MPLRLISQWLNYISFLVYFDLNISYYNASLELQLEVINSTDELRLAV